MQNEISLNLAKVAHSLFVKYHHEFRKYLDNSERSFSMDVNYHAYLVYLFKNLLKDGLIKINKETYEEMTKKEKILKKHGFTNEYGEERWTYFKREGGFGKYGFGKEGIGVAIHKVEFSFQHNSLVLDGQIHDGMPNSYFVEVSCFSNGLFKSKKEALENALRKINEDED